MKVCVLAFTMLMAAISHAQVRPTEGFVPDSATAVVIAEAVLIPIYGKERIQSERPFTATLKDDVWSISGTLHCPAPNTGDISGAHPKARAFQNCMGGVATVEISKVDAHIISMIHGK